MAVRSNSSLDELYFDSGLPAVQPLTVFGRALLRSKRASAYQFLVGMESAGASAWAQMGYKNNGNWYVAGSAGNSSEVTGPAVGLPFCFALVASGTGANQLTGYWWHGYGAVSSLQATGPNFTPARLSLLNDSADEWCDGDVEDVNIVTAALTLPELQSAWQRPRGKAYAHPKLWASLPTRSLYNGHGDASGLSSRRWKTAGSLLTSPPLPATENRRRRWWHRSSIKPPGTQAYTGDVNEAVTLSEAVAVVAAHPVPLSETITLSDSITVGNTTELAETLALAESIAVVRGMAEALPENLTLAETMAANDYQGALSETVTLSESLASLANLFLTVSESVALSESVIGGNVFLVGLNETLTLAESLASQATLLLTVSETVTLSESLAKVTGFVQALSESMALAESLEAGTFNVNIGETVALAESLATLAAYAQSLAESIALAELLTGAIPSTGRLVSSTFTQYQIKSTFE